MKYELFFTDSAKRDLNRALDYIEFVLKNKEASNHLLDFVEKNMSLLASNPKLHPIVNDPVLSSWHIRTFSIKNYIVFYTIIDKTIYIIRFLSSRRDWESILKQWLLSNN